MVNICVLGISCVGKTALTYRFIDHKAPLIHDPTGEDKFTTVVEVDNESITVNILDTAGQDSFQGLLDSWIETGEGFVLVFAVNERNSFLDLEIRKRKIDILKGNQKVPIILVGNKNDLDIREREVSKDEGINKAKSWGASYIETSALSNDGNCKEPFFECIRKILKKDMNSKQCVSNNSDIKVNNGCCNKCYIF